MTDAKARAAEYLTSDSPTSRREKNLSLELCWACSFSKGMATGAAVGGIILAVAAGLSSVGLLAAPGMGVYVVGQWLSILTGFGAGALGGGLIGGLIGLGMPEHVADLYKAEVEKGGILMGVYAADDASANQIRSVFEQNGAEHIKIEGVKQGTGTGRKIA